MLIVIIVNVAIISIVAISELRFRVQGLLIGSAPSSDALLKQRKLNLMTKTFSPANPQAMDSATPCVAPRPENQMEEYTENEMGTGILWVLAGVMIG